MSWSGRGQRLGQLTHVVMNSTAFGIGMDVCTTLERAVNVPRGCEESEFSMNRTRMAMKYGILDVLLVPLIVHNHVYCKS